MEEKKKIIKVKRNTEEGKEKQAEFEKAKDFEKNLLKVIAEDSDVEEDFPVVKLSELLDEKLNFEENKGADSDDED